MSKFLFHLGRSSARHPFRVLGIWLIAAIAIVSLQGAVGGQFDNSFRVPGVESQHAADVLNARFPTHGGQSARLVLHTNTGRLDDAGHAPTVTDVREQLARGHRSRASLIRWPTTRAPSAPTARPPTSTSPIGSTS